MGKITPLMEKIKQNLTGWFAVVIACFPGWRCGVILHQSPRRARLADRTIMWNHESEMRFRRLLVLLLCGLVELSTAACSDSTLDAAKNVDADVLHRGIAGDPVTLDPSIAEDIHAFQVLRDLYEGLVTETADGSLVPGVAETWELSADGLQYTFFLREDAVWSDGQPVTAADFVDSFRRTISPDSRSPYASLLFPIRRAQEVLSGEIPAERLGVRAIDERTLEIQLSAPTPYFPAILAMPVSYPLYGGREPDGRQFSDPEAFVGNGPYLLRRWQPGSLIRLERNPRFRESEIIRIPAVEYHSIQNPFTEWNRYRAGELDITATVPSSMVAALRDERPAELRISPALALYYVALDMSESLMSNRDLRLALSLAIDREKLTDVIGRGEQPAYGIVPDGVPGYRAARYSWQDVSAAERESLAIAAYGNAGYGETNPLNFKLIYDVGDIHETVALAIASMWRDVLGVHVELDKREWAYFLDTRNNKDEWDAMRFSWFGDYNDASTFLEIFRSGSVQNLSAFSSEDYDDLLDRASRTLDTAQRAELMAEAERLLLDSTPVIPLYFFVNKHLVSPRVLNFQSNILDIHPSRYFELAENRR